MAITALLCAMSAGRAYGDVSGSGTSDDPYTVGTAAEWNEVASEIASTTSDYCYVKITEDITFTDDDPITAFTTFYGELDGGSKTIDIGTCTTTATYQGGLINTAGSSSNLAYIHDLTVKGTLTSSSYNYCGGVVSSLYGTVKNVECAMEITGNQYTGGIVSYAYSSSSIEDCTFSGTINSTKNYTAGIVGYATGTEFKNCVNKGTISTSGTYGAGIVSNVYDAYCTLESCTFEGTLTYTGTTTSSYTAGIVSYCNKSCTLTDCGSTGTITISKPNSVGFISGVVAGVSISGSNTLTMTRCYNKSDLTGACRMGGVLGGYYGASLNVTMTDCYNTGNITVGSYSQSSSAYNYSCGGLCAACFRSSTYSGCYNTGKVDASASSTGYVGGLFGYGGYKTAEGYQTTITGCYNTGEVISGGITPGA